MLFEVAIVLFITMSSIFVSFHFLKVAVEKRLIELTVQEAGMEILNEHLNTNETEKGIKIDFSKLISEQKSWAEHNFPDPENKRGHQPLLGMIEELGELSHAILKREQGIRGYDDNEKYKSEIIDAVGDICIYLADYCNRKNIVPKFGLGIQHPRSTIWKTVIDCARSIVMLDEMSESKKSITVMTGYSAGILIKNLENICDHLEIDFDIAVQETWNHVKSRDWVKFPKNGKTE